MNQGAVRSQRGAETAPGVSRIGQPPKAGRILPLRHLTPRPREPLVEPSAHRGDPVHRTRARRDELPRRKHERPEAPAARHLSRPRRAPPPIATAPGQVNQPTSNDALMLHRPRTRRDMTPPRSRPSANRADRQQELAQHHTSTPRRSRSRAPGWLLRLHYYSWRVGEKGTTDERRHHAAE